MKILIRKCAHSRGWANWQYTKCILGLMSFPGSRFHFGSSFRLQPLATRFYSILFVAVYSKRKISRPNRPKLLHLSNIHSTVFQLTVKQPNDIYDKYSFDCFSIIHLTVKTAE